MKSISPLKNIFRNKGRYFILLLLFVPLISGIIASVDLLSTSVSYMQRINEKFGGTLVMDVNPPGCNIKNVMKQITDDSFIKEVYYPGVETNSLNLNNSLNISYKTGEIIKKDEMELKPPISYIGLDTSLIKYTHDEFNFINGKMYKDNNECVINKGNDQTYIWASLIIGDKIILSGNGDDIVLTISGIIQNENISGHNTNGQLLYTTPENVFKIAKQYQDLAKTVTSSVPEEFADQSIPDISFADPDNPFMISLINYVNGRDEYGYKCVVLLKESNLYTPYFHYLESIKSALSPVLRTHKFYTQADAVIETASQTNRTSLIFLGITLSMIIITTVITSIMYLSNRKYEFAVLCSVGMSKFKIMGSYIIETLTFIFITSIISIIAGQTIFIFYISENLKAGYKNLIDTSLPITNILLVNGAAVLAGMVIIVAVTVIISMIYMLSFEPLKIFNKRYS